MSRGLWRVWGLILLGILGSVSPMSSTEIVRSAVELGLTNGQIVSLADLKKAMAKPAVRPEPPEKTPLPAVITDDERAALALLPLVFGQVNPDTKRKLTEPELTKIFEERQTLDTVEKMTASRKADIRTAVVNHLDEVSREAGLGEDTWFDSEGHVLKTAHVNIPGSKKCFSWEVREGNPSGLAISESSLRDLSLNPEIPFSHEDYLAVTSQVRVIDENKFILHLRKHPELLPEIAKAVTPAGAPVGSFYVRAAKK